MYKIPIPSKRILQAYADDMKPKLKNLIKKYHPKHGATVIKGVVNNKKSLKLDVKVDNGLLTEWFLDWLLVDANLEKLLMGSMNDIIEIVNMVEAERAKRGIAEALVYEKMSGANYDRIYHKKVTKPKKDTKEVFNAVLYQIFVKEGYEVLDVFDKSAHVSSLNLRICPYCGRSYIYAVDDGNGEVKPQIDHFLPKRKYPFLALSFFNLIPVCSTCNMTSCKGDFDPMPTIGRTPFKIEYPYEFKDGDFKFVLGVHNSHYFEDENFDVWVDFNGNTELEEGENKAFKLGEFYKHHNREAANIYRQLMTLKSRANVYYKQFGLSRLAFQPNPRLVLGFKVDEETSRKEILYKLKKDIYQQINK